MSEIKASFRIDESKKVIFLTGIRKDIIDINFSEDIDFTELVQELTKLIDKSIPVRLNNESSEINDDKIKMIVGTLTSIVDKYNENITVIDNSGQVSIDIDDEIID